MRDIPIISTESVAELRARAARTRRHAIALRFDEAALKLLALANEFDAEADAMERLTLVPHVESLRPCLQLIRECTNSGRRFVVFEICGKLARALSLGAQPGGGFRRRHGIPCNLA